MTTRELINEYLILTELKEELENDNQSGKGVVEHDGDGKNQRYDNVLANLDNTKVLIYDKIKSIDNFIQRTEILIGSVQGEKQAINNELEIVKKREARLFKLKDFLLNDLVGLAINNLGDGKVWEHNGAKYTKVEKKNVLKIDSEEHIPDRAYTLTPKLSKTALKKMLLEGEEIKGVELTTTSWIKRS